MELRFPAPSSDEAIPLDSSISGTTLAPVEVSAIKGATESNALAATYHRVTDRPTMTSVAPVYRSVRVPRKGDSPVLLKGTNEDGNCQSSMAASVAAVLNSSTPDPAGNLSGVGLSVPNRLRGPPSCGPSGVCASGSVTCYQPGVCLS